MDGKHRLDLGKRDGHKQDWQQVEGVQHGKKVIKTSRPSWQSGGQPKA